MDELKDLAEWVKEYRDGVQEVVKRQPPVKNRAMLQGVCGALSEVLSEIDQRIAVGGKR